MNTVEWIDNTIEKLEAKIPEISHGDFRFYNLSHMPLIAKKTAEYQENCSICASHVEIIDELVDNLPLVLTQNAKNRKLFEVKKHQIEKHLKKNHACRFPGYYAALGSLIGISIGIIFTLGTIYIGHMPLFNKLSLIGLAVFLLTGKFIGDYIDKNVFRKKLQL